MRLTYGVEINNLKTLAFRRLRQEGTLSTIDKHTCRVLPKRRTPSVGITLRSLSGALGFHRSSVNVVWKQFPECKAFKTAGRPAKQHLNLLLVPWPTKISAKDFVVKDDGRDDYGRFSFELDRQEWTEAILKRHLKHVLDRATDECSLRSPDVSPVDLVVMPEAVLAQQHVGPLEEVLLEHRVSGYVAGVRVQSQNGLQSNCVNCKFLVGRQYEGIQQSKHHRWKIDYAQARQYQLGGKLTCGRTWWEGIDIQPRQVSFIDVGDSMTICPLICEDLARQDPIADLVRTVGPTAVIAILLDGPQLKHRWSARYASILADDPGSSVLTLTAYGMVRRSRGPNGEKSRAIALWRDSSGETIEIDLEPGHEAVLLYLSGERTREALLDGRRERDQGSLVLRFGGSWQVPRLRSTEAAGGKSAFQLPHDIAGVRQTPEREQQGGE